MSNKEEEKTAEAAPAAEAPAAEAQKEEAAAPVETSYTERKLKDGEYYLKRANGKPRFRKITCKKHEAKLFCLVKGEWVQKPAKPKIGRMHTLKWHVQNKWQRIEKAQAVAPAVARKPKAAAAEKTDA